MKTVSIDLIRKVIDDRARWILKDSSGYVYWYVYNPLTHDGRNIAGCIGRVEVDVFKGKDWEDCIWEIKPDLTKSVGKLCWFWNNDGDEPVSGRLDGAVTLDHKYRMVGGGSYEHCKPLKNQKIDLDDQPMIQPSQGY